MEYTKGPWKIDRKCCYGWEIYSSAGKWVGAAFNSHDQNDAFPTDEEGEVNARLKTAAPELLEALDALTLVIGLTPIAGNKDALQEAVDAARAAIAKARGNYVLEQVE